MQQPNQQCQFKRLTSSGIIKTGAGLCNGFMVVTGTPTITLYDGVDNTGVLIYNGLVTTAGTPYPCPALVNVGIYAVLGGAGDVTFFYN
jgi:hypothetical protein